jgi:glutamyl-tRNA synthetase
LLTGAQGEGLSKRLGSLGLKDLKDQNYEPMAIINYLGHLGNPEATDLALTMDDVVKHFDLSKYGKSSPKFSPEDLLRSNEKYLQHVSFEAIAPRLKDLGFTKTTPAFWQAIQGNLLLLTDVKAFETICFEAVTPRIEDPAFMATALACLPLGPWDEETWKEWTTVISEKTGQKGKALFMPLRQALTGDDHGPEMKKLLPFIGHTHTTKRLQGQIA